MIAESTCSAIFGAELKGTNGGSALLGYMELTRIALERCTTARGAIELMGALAEEHGFAGNSAEVSGSAESLSLVDSEEAWVMHIMPDDTGTSAIWAAQRVADGHAAVVPNIFVIRTIDLSEEAGATEFLLSTTATEVAARLGLWSPGTPFDFTRIYSANEPRPFYCGRRQWRALSLFAPSLDLSPDYTDLLRDAPYPFSVKPDAPLCRHDFFRIMRDTFAGTCFDMSKQPASGPFGLSDWYDSGLPDVVGDEETGGAEDSAEDGAKRRILDAAKEREAAKEEAEAAKATPPSSPPPPPPSRRGAISFDERPIGVFRMAYSYVGEPSPCVEGGDGALPALFHFAPHASPTSVYVPIPCALQECPEPLATGSVRAIDRRVAYWAFRILKQTARGLPWAACLREVEQRQAVWEGRADQMLEDVRIGARASLLAAEEGGSELEHQAAWHELARDVVDDWALLLDELLLRYGDGWEHEWDEDGERRCKPIEYPAEWLEGLGFTMVEVGDSGEGETTT